MKLDERKLRILKATIDDYILTAAPIGSRTISKRADFNLSSATIRNEMSDLEEMGLLEQPHTSAGRVPSDLAYRLYVNDIMQRAKLSKEEMQVIRSYFNQRLDEIGAVAKRTARALSDVTKYVAMVMPPSMHKIRLKHIQLVPIRQGQVLAVIVTDVGLTREVMIRVPESLGIDELERLSRMLTKRFFNMQLDQIDTRVIQELESELGGHRAFLENVLQAVQNNLEPASHTVELSGATNMLNYPEYKDMDKARSFFSAIEGKDTLYNMLLKNSTLETSITIGGENELEELKDCSVITATYRVGGGMLGTFGIIGPTRMNYAKVLSVLEFMRASLSEVFAGMMDDKI